MWEGEYAESKLRHTKEPEKHLLEIYGIGNKVCACICLFGLHMLDSFPIDTHIQKILDREYNGNLPDWVNSKYAGLFQQYLFYFETHEMATK